MVKTTKNSQKLNVSFLRRNPFLFIDKLLKKFKDGEVYIVGGSVRDILLGLEINDCDFVVRNVKAKDLEKFLATQGKVNLVGKRFGVFKFKPKNSDLIDFDIALPRTEHSLNFRGVYKDFKIQSNPKLEIQKDLARRDFTINAMAWDVKNKILIDEFGGLTDLKKKIIKTVGKPQDRFKEDYSRMLRAIRFSCQLGFKIELKTLTAIKKLMPHINDKVKGERVVAYEVIAKELLKSFTTNPIKAFDYFDKTGAFKTLMPEILKMKGCPQPTNWHTEGDVWVHTRLGFEILSSNKFKRRFSQKDNYDSELVMAVLFHDLGKPYTIKTPKDGADRIRFNGHDAVGAKMTREICTRLKLTSPSDFNFSCDNVAVMVGKHMLLVHGRPKEMKNTTIEKYFFKDARMGENFLKLIFIDASATVPKSGKADMNLFNQLTRRLKQLEKLQPKNKKTLAKPIITGHDIMKTYKLKQGKNIGKLIAVAREAQLAGKIKTKKQGLAYIKKHL
ncbi:CCA tRNA nucleotidyltransferase [Patescibacteria group bacterium]|nr:CCA tRNA nucleotidyltransferase [Patescibacteria group bacterium]